MPNQIDKEVLKNIKRDIENAKDLIEIAGPSPDGYLFFRENNITPPKWRVTNIKTPIVINPYGANPITADVEIVNARKMPFNNGTIDVFLVSYLSISTDLWLKIPRVLGKTYVSKIFYNLAKREYKKGSAKKGVNLRITFLVEAFRCLKPGGLIVFVGARPEDHEKAEATGYQIIVSEYIAKDESVTAIYKKPL